MGTNNVPYQPPPTMKKRYKRLLIALLAVAGLYIARETGLDQGLIDEVMGGVVEAVSGEDE